MEGNDVSLEKSPHPRARRPSTPIPFLIPNDLYTSKDQSAVFISNIANAVRELRKEGREETRRREGEVYKLEEWVGQLECQIAKLERQITELESKDKKEDGEEGWTGVVRNGSRTPGGRGTSGTKIVSSRSRWFSKSRRRRIGRSGILSGCAAG